MFAAKRSLELTDDSMATPPAAIVLAEDDAELRQLLVSALARDGHEVIAARDGSELVTRLGAFWIRHAAPDLIITDVRMPGASGLDVLEVLRARLWKTPVIVITAFGDRAIHEKARSLGAARVFDKPFDVDDLRAAVSSLLGRGAP
jgi:DNA-binding response OmpR family regulator